jgi:hypothetical protein
MVFVAQLNKEHVTLEVILDDKALSILRNVLNKKWSEPIKNENGLYDIDHEHLESKEWGGNELTPEYTTEGFVKIEAIKIVYIGKAGDQLIS